MDLIEKSLIPQIFPITTTHIKMTNSTYARLSMMIALVFMAIQGFVPNYPAQAMLCMAIMFYEWGQR